LELDATSKLRLGAPIVRKLDAGVAVGALSSLGECLTECGADAIAIASGTECVLLDKRTLRTQMRIALPARASTSPTGNAMVFVGCENGNVVRVAPQSDQRRIVALGTEPIVGLSRGARSGGAYVVDAAGRLTLLDAEGNTVATWLASAPPAMPPFDWGGQALLATLDGSFEIFGREPQVAAFARPSRARGGRE
jgi:hypothetical protein